MTDVPQTEEASIDPHAECTVRLAECEAKWKRARADYENREKDIAREREEFARFCTVDLVRDVLPVMDAIAAAGGKTPEVDTGGKTSGVDGKTPDVEEPASDVELAPTSDASVRAGGASGEPAAQRGFRAIQVLLHNFLKRHGVEPVGAVGDRVDYLLHEVVGTRAPSEREQGREQEQLASGTIFEVVQVGYTIHGRLLRPAKVIVREGEQ